MDRDFHNLYRHGFARIAACTLPVTMADLDHALRVTFLRHFAD